MVNVNDTDISSTMTLKVEIQGIDELQENENLLVYGMDKTEVSITVKGSNRDLVKFGESDYSATINVSEIKNAGKHSLPISVSTPTGSSITLVSSEIQKINLYTDYSSTKTVPFQVIDNDVFTGVYTYNVESNADSMEITGPKSMIDKVANAQFHIPDAEYYSSKSFTGFSVMFCDKNGDYIAFEENTVRYSTTDMTVKVNVSTKMNIPVRVNVLESDPAIHALPSVEQITVIGDPMILAPYLQGTQKLEYIIEIAYAKLDETYTKTLSGEQLPEGITLENEGQSITVTFVQAEKTE
jgi:YbbR domain-containing protein